MGITCKENNCNKVPHYNLKGEKRLYCSEHKKENMINVTSKLCIENNCNKQSIFNLPNKKISLYCSEHKKENIINVTSKLCIENNCNEIANFNFINLKGGLYCFTHKKQDMINIKNRKCLEKSCKKNPTFNFQNEKVGFYCKDHKKENMINIKITVLEVNCKECNIKFKKSINQIIKYENNFCSRKCSSKYNNRNKKTGFRVFKLEVYLQKNLKGYKFDFNNRSICDGLELDIYIDKLKIAFEINGIVHYKLIYGKEKYENIVKKDILKNKLCKEKEIILYTIIYNFNIKYSEEILKKIYLLIHKIQSKFILKDICPS